MTAQDLINNFLSITADVYKETKEFLKLSHHQLNWRPSEKRWSVGECFEHLIRTNGKYIPEYQKYSPSDYAHKREEFKHSFVGKILYSSMKTENKRKMKTPASFNPLGGAIKDSIVKDFLHQSNDIVELISKIEVSKLKVTIRSPFSKYIRYSIGDSLMIMAYHNLRHLKQAKEVTQNEGFPS
jgi:hypothetical protein